MACRAADRIGKRNALVNATMSNVQTDLAKLGASIDDRVRLHAQLHALSTPLLEATARMNRYGEVEAAVRDRNGRSLRAIRGEVATKALGDIDQDLVFVPPGPCRIVDTRTSAAGPIAGGTARFFKYFSARGQGVTTGPCNTFGSGTGVGYYSGYGGAIAISVTGVAPGRARPTDRTGC